CASSGRPVRISQRPLPIARHNGIPTGQRHCARNRSLPIACLSSSVSSFSHSLTGSVSVILRKKVSRNFFGLRLSATCCPVRSTLHLKMCRRRSATRSCRIPDRHHAKSLSCAFRGRNPDRRERHEDHIGQGYIAHSRTLLMLGCPRLTPNVHWLRRWSGGS